MIRALAIIVFLTWLGPLKAPADVLVTRPDPLPNVGILSDDIGVPLLIDFNSDGATDLFLDSNSGVFSAHFASGNRIAILSSPPPNLGGIIAGLDFGSTIGSSLDPVIPIPSLRWYDGELVTDPEGSLFGDRRATAILNLFPSGMSGDVISREAVIPFEFLINGRQHYGYVELDFNGNSTSPYRGGAGPIIGWAYEERPGVPILAQPLAVPEPAALSLLVFSLGIGVLARRKSRMEKPSLAEVKSHYG